MNKIPLSNVSLFECGSYHRQNNTESVSWQSTGSLLASSTPGSVKLWNCPTTGSESTSTGAVGGGVIGAASSGVNSAGNVNVNAPPILLREYITLDHNRIPVRDVRFHPHDSNVLCSNVKNGTVQLWDIRSRNTSRPVEKIHLKSSAMHFASTMEWMGGFKQSPSTALTTGNGSETNNAHAYNLLIGESDSSLHVYDMRKLQQQSKQKQQQARNTKTSQIASSSDSSSSGAIQSFSYAPHELTGAQFTPSGTHLISAVKNTDNNMGCLIVHPWKQSDIAQKQQSNKHISINDMLSSSSAYQFIGHCSKIYSIRFSPNGQYMATGGNDALVALWDIQSMTCTSTITRRNKSIRGISFSYDSKLLACCSEEDGIDISHADSGELIANVNISRLGKNMNSGGGRNIGGRGGVGGGNDRMDGDNQYGGADEIAFHPKSYLLACARGRDPREIGAQVPFVTIAKVQDVMKL